MKSAPGPLSRGFTLIEMVITLSVFLLLAAAIFSIFGATLQSASTLQENQNREDSTQALAAWLRHSFLQIPAGGVLTSYHRQDQPFHVSGVIWGSGDNLEAVDIRRQPNGNYLVRLALYESGNTSRTLTGSVAPNATLLRFQTLILADDPTLKWRPLVRDLKTADWRFRQANAADWNDTSSGDKPLLAEFTFQPAGTAVALVNDFWIPPLIPATSPALPQSAPAVGANP